MFFIISKIILYILLPPASLIVIIASGILFLKRHPRFARILIVVGIIFLYLLSIRPVADGLLRPLETAFHPVDNSFISSADSIVILTGGAVDLSWLGIKPAPSHASLARLIHGITVYRQMPGAKLIISGGSGDPDKPYISEADAMKDAALALGVPDKDIIVENKSRNTIESVRALQKIIGGKKIVLVTSAYHMKRAAAMFRKNGMDVLPAPADYLTEQKGFSPYDAVPKAASLLHSSIALYEYMGFGWYWLIGKL